MHSKHDLYVIWIDNEPRFRVLVDHRQLAMVVIFRRKDQN